MKSYIVLSLATTGLPREGYVPSIVEIAAVLVLPGKNKVKSGGSGEFYSLVGHPDTVLETQVAREAASFHGITSALLKNAPCDRDVQLAFSTWHTGLSEILFSLGHSLGGWRAYNHEFVSGMLNRPGWREAAGGYTVPGRCIMDEACEVMWAHGLLKIRRDGNPCPPTQRKAITWLRGRGHIIPELTGRARRGAEVGVALCRALQAENALLSAATDAVVVPILGYPEKLAHYEEDLGE